MARKSKQKGAAVVLADLSPVEALAVAVKREVGASCFYEALSRRVTHALAAAKFRYLAEEERYHRDLLVAVLKTLKGSARRVSSLKGLSEARGRLPKGVSNADAVRSALNAEKEAAEFYTACATRCRNADGKAMFARLADEEKRHRVVLEHELRVLTEEPFWSSLEGRPWAEDDFWHTGGGFCR